MLRKSFAWFIIAICLVSARAEDQVSAATKADTTLPPQQSPQAQPSQEVRSAGETDFKKTPQIDPNIKITKVHEFQNTEKYNGDGHESLEFERAYWNYGAILADEVESRRGHYFVITWVNKGPAANFTTRFEYRQNKTRDVVRTLTMEHPNAKGASRSTFAVLGDAYRAYGPVTSWRFSVWQGDKLVGEEKSFIW